MENNITFSTRQLAVLTDALEKIKERFDKGIQENDAGKIDSCVYQMNHISSAITDAVKAEHERNVEDRLRRIDNHLSDIDEAIDELDEAICDESFDTRTGGEDGYERH